MKINKPTRFKSMNSNYSVKMLITTTFSCFLPLYWKPVHIKLRSLTVFRWTEVSYHSSKDISFDNTRIKITTPWGHIYNIELKEEAFM